MVQPHPLLTPPLLLPLDPPAAGSEMHPAQNQGRHTQPQPHSHRQLQAPGRRGGLWGGGWHRALANASGAGSAAGGPGLGCIPNPP